MLYHSSTEEAIDKIVEDGLTKIENPSFNQLIQGKVEHNLGSFGVGFYGFLDDKELSIEFIKRELKNDKYKTIQFDINVNPDNLIDFSSNVDDIRMFKLFWQDKHVASMWEKMKLFYPDSGRAKKLQGALIEYYINNLQNRKKVAPIKAVKGSSQTSDYGMLRGLLVIPDGIECCIRDEKIVDKGSISLV